MGTISSQPNLKTRQIDLQISGMTCSSCVNTIETSLNKLPGVRAVVNLAMETAHVIAPEGISEEQLIREVKASGYQASAFKGERESFEKSSKLGVRLLLTFILTAPIIAIS
ncbi:MAG: heavy-metal-associated domain-containing protein, partial [Actinobacteria bacterium]|nr:heavy-metal-associated domain-containing protein [Actinomycetota bacterium]